MSALHGRTAGRIKLRTELRQLREQATLTQEQAATEMEWSLSKLVRIEAGTVGISVNDLRALLGLYGVQERTQVDDLLDLARVAKKRAWWSQYREVLAPPYLEFIGCEADASTIRYFHPTVIPVLLQTEEYARAIVQDAALESPDSELAEPRLKVRLTRIQETFNRPEPARMTVLLDEAVLHRVVGSVEVMRTQLHHLATLATRRTISLGVIPFAAGAHPGLYGSFVLFEFADPADDAVLYVEQAQHQMLLRDRPDQVSEYERTFARLSELALPYGESITRVLRAADEITP